MVIEVLSQQADFEARRQKMLASWDDLEKFVASQTYSDVDSADLVREDRDSH